MKTYIKKFSDTCLYDVKEVGTKSAYLADIYNNMSSKHVMVPDGFAITIAAYRYFIKFNKLDELLLEWVDQVNISNYSNLKAISARARKAIMDAHFPEDLLQEISLAYGDLYEGDILENIAVRGSVSAEDMKEAYFADNYGSYLNIKGYYGLMHAVKLCYASLFEEKAIKYRIENRVNEQKVAISACVHQMVMAGSEGAGSCFTHIAGTPGSDVVVITAAWGLTENPDCNLYNTPDEYKVLKESLESGKVVVIQKTMGRKSCMMTYAEDDNFEAFTKNIDTPVELQNKVVLSDNEIVKLANWSLLLERHYTSPISFKWAKDEVNHQIFVLEARPEVMLKPVLGY